MIIKFKFIFIVSFCASIISAKAQNLNVELSRDFLEIYEAQPASARAAAMGFAQVANGGTISEARINPATLGSMPQKLQTEFAHSWHSFVDKKASTSFIGAAYKVNSRLTVGVSRFSYDVKEPFFGYIKDQNTSIFPEKVSETFYTGTVSYEIKKGFSAGVNLNYFNYHIEGLPNAGSLLADAGVVYERDLKTKGNVINPKLSVAASFTNLNRAKTQWKFSDGPVDVIMTSHLFAGARLTSGLDLKKYFYGQSKLVDGNSRRIDLLLQVQYVNFLNMKLSSDEEVSHKNQNKIWGLNAGAEILFLKVLALRFGYRYEKRQGDNAQFLSTRWGNFPYKKGFTFGAGINLPVNRLSNGKIPFDISIDHVHKHKPFHWIKENNYIEEEPTTNINLRLNWYLKNNR